MYYSSASCHIEQRLELMCTVPHVHDRMCMYAVKSPQVISHAEDRGVSNISDIVSPSSGIDTMLNAAPCCIHMQGMPSGGNKMPWA